MDNEQDSPAPAPTFVPTTTVSKTWDGSGRPPHGTPRDRFGKPMPNVPFTVGVASMPEQHVPEQPVPAGGAVVVRRPKPGLVLRDGPNHDTYSLTDRGMSAVEDCARQGLSDTAIGRHLNISHNAFREMQKRDPRIGEALTRGRSVLNEEVTATVLSHMRAGSLTAAMHLSRYLCGWAEKGATPTNVTVNTQLNVGNAMSPADFDRLVAMLPLGGQTIDIPKREG